MEMVTERVAGLDVHKATVVACVRVPGRAGRRESHTHEFATTTAGLLALRDWLDAHGVTVCGMEATGTYWKPVYYILERGTPYEDLGADWFIRRHSPERHARRLVHQLERLGFDVQIQEHAAA